MYRGVFTALVTPFRKDRSIDEVLLRKLVDRQIEAGVDGLVPMGTTGESPTLSHNEHIEIVRSTVDQAGGRVPVIAGAGSNSTQEAVDLTKRAKDAGADAALHVSPYYNKPTPEGIFLHYRTIAEEGRLPVIIYNIPGRTGINIDNATMLRLTEIENIAGVKDATGNLPQLMELMARKPPDFCVLSGDDNMTLPIVALGGDGIISVASNLIPGQMKEFIQAALKPNLGKARSIHFRLLPLFKVLFIETNPIPVKTAMAMSGLIEEIFRLPMCPMLTENRSTLKAVLAESKLL